jgi:quercetin dioxygenase-like cupin family protein
MENDKMTGTVDSHMRIADALGLRLPELYNDVLNESAKLKDKEITQKIETFARSTGVVAELLTTRAFQKKMMPVLLKMKSKATTHKESYPKSTERFIYVIAGALEIFVNSEKHILKQDDSLYFDASLLHFFKSGRATKCLSIVSPASS